MTAAAGRLVLIPNTLDLGSGHETALDTAVPRGALERAAGLRHWVVENAKSARAFLKRVNTLHPLAVPLQSLSMAELPRPPKGRPGAGDAAELARRLQALLEPARLGHDIGLLSEAGMPAVADPGSELVAAAHDAGLTVEPWPGPSSLMLALAASGLNGQQFAFVGYLPVEPTARDARIRELDALSRRQHQTQIAIETPYRNASLWAALLAQLSPQTRVAVSCGLGLPGGWCTSLRVRDARLRPVTFEQGLPAVFCWGA